MAKNSQSNKNIIQINNLVKMAEEKKKRKYRKRQPVVAMEAVDAQPLLASRIMQQMPPQVQPIIQQTFPGIAPDQDLNKAVQDAVSSQAAQINEMRDQRDRENMMLANAIDAVTRGIRDTEQRPFIRGQGRASNRASGPVVVDAQETFADELPGRSEFIPVERQYKTTEAQRLANKKSREKKKAELEALRARAGNSNVPVVEAFPIREEKWNAYGFSE